MPPKGKYKKRKKESKRRTYKRKRNYNQITNVSRTPIAKRALIKMRYIEDIQIDPDNTSTPVASYFFRASDVYDPNYSSAGHQPHGFDQWMTFYNHFTVIGSKITAKFISNSTGVNVCWVGVNTQSDANITQNSTLMRENGQGTWKYMTGESDKPIVVHKKFSAKRFFGTKNIIGEDSYKGSASASPQENAYYAVMCGNINSNNPGTVNVSICIDYIVMLTEPKSVGQS